MRGISDSPTNQYPRGRLNPATGRGLVVAPLEPDEVQHMYDLREAIEGVAARQAARLAAARAPPSSARR